MIEEKIIAGNFIHDFIDEDLAEGGRCDWWLRTALHNYSSGAFIANIDPNGYVNASTHNCRHTLRPVCWIEP